MADLLFPQERINVAVPTRCVWVVAGTWGRVNGGPHRQVVTRCLVPVTFFSTKPLYKCLS